jgi:cytochrome c oxidase subunit II
MSTASTGSTSPTPAPRQGGRRPAWLATLAALAVMALQSPLCAALVAPLQAAQGVDGPKRWGPNPVASTDGHRVDKLFWVITALVSVSFLIVLLLLLVTVLRDRARPGVKARYDHGSSLHDKRFTAIVSVVVFLALDASVLWITMTDLRESVWNIPKGEAEILRVEVLAQQWAWNFRTPGVDGQFGTADDVVTLNELHVPEGRPVVLHGSSKDVIHSLYIPDMRIKRDVNPGAINKVWFQAAQSGDFEILGAELCGFAHYQMHGTLTVLPAERWNAWHAEASAIAQATHDETDTEARWAWDWKE